MKNKLFLLAVVLLMGAGLAGCGNTADPNTPTSIEIIEKTDPIDVGQNYTVNYVVLPSTAQYELIWAVNDQSIATISDGVLHGIKAGNVEVTVQIKNHTSINDTASFVIKDNTIYPTSVEVTATSSAINIGEETQVTASFLPVEATPLPIVWTSSNPLIADVSSAGVVIGLKAGTTTIKGAAASSSSLFDTVDIEVVPDPIPPSEVISINNARTKSLALSSQENDKGVVTSRELVKVQGKVLASLDLITTKSGYGERYKIIIGDNTNYIGVSVNETNRDKLNHLESSYKVTGYVSLYLGQPEIVLTSYEIVNEVITSDSYVTAMNNVNEIYERALALRTNCKGCIYSSLVSFKAFYYMKAVSSVLYFTDHTKVIQIHSSNSKLANSFSVGSQYNITGLITMNNFKPGIEHVSSEVYTGEEDYELDLSLSETITGVDAYKTSYEVDKLSSYPNYSNRFKTSFIFEGYISRYTKDDKEYMVLVDEYQDYVFDTYTNARDAKALFINNDEDKALSTSQDYINSPMYQIDPTKKFTINLFMYLWNTSDYWMVYVLHDTLTIL